MELIYKRNELTEILAKLRDRESKKITLEEIAKVDKLIEEEKRVRGIVKE